MTKQASTSPNHHYDGTHPSGTGAQAPCGHTPVVLDAEGKAILDEQLVSNIREPMRPLRVVGFEGSGAVLCMPEEDAGDLEVISGSELAHGYVEAVELQVRLYK